MVCDANGYGWHHGADGHAAGAAAGLLAGAPMGWRGMRTAMTRPIRVITSPSPPPTWRVLIGGPQEFAGFPEQGVVVPTRSSG